MSGLTALVALTGGLGAGSLATILVVGLLLVGAVTGIVAFLTTGVASIGVLLLGGGGLLAGAVTGVMSLFTTVVAREGFLLDLSGFILALASDVALLTTVEAFLLATATATAHSPM